MKIEELIYEKYCEESLSSFPKSYKLRKKADVSLDKLEKTLNSSQKKLYNTAIDDFVYYFIEKQYEMVYYIFNFLRSLFK